MSNPTETRADRIEAAARALLADIDNTNAETMYFCERYACGALSMVNVHNDTICDECAAEYPADARTDRSYAPAVRALRAALAEAP